MKADDGIQPAGPGAAPALPERIWEPSPWLPRLLVGLSAGLVLVAGAALARWRRRARP